MDVSQLSFSVIWSEEDSEFVGLCSKFPSLSFLAKTSGEAMAGIRFLVSDVLADLNR